MADLCIRQRTLTGALVAVGKPTIAALPGPAAGAILPDRRLLALSSRSPEGMSGSGVVENTHTPNADAIAIFGDSILYVNLDECTSCTACYQPDVCPVGAIYSEEHVPDGTPAAKYNSSDPNTGHDHTFFVAQSRAVFAD